MGIDRIVAGTVVPVREHNACPGALSRRRFLQSAGGVVVLGTAVTKGVVWPSMAAAGPGVGNVLPIDTTLEAFGHHFHVQAPPFTGADSDPATVTNFRGATGIAYISGSCERIDRRSGQVGTFPFIFNDVRFQQGAFRGRDGHQRDAAFAFT